MGAVARIGGGENEIDHTSKWREENWVMGHGQTIWGPFSHLSSIVSFLQNKQENPIYKIDLFFENVRQIMAGTKFAKMERSEKSSEKKGGNDTQRMKRAAYRLLVATNRDGWNGWMQVRIFVQIDFFRPTNQYVATIHR